VPRAHQPIAFDIAIADPAAVVRAHVVHHDQCAARQPSHCHGPHTVASGHDRTDRHEIELVDGYPPVVGVIPELVEDLRVDRTHPSKLRMASDIAGFPVPCPLPVACRLFAGFGGPATRWIS